MPHASLNSTKVCPVLIFRRGKIKQKTKDTLGKKPNTRKEWVTEDTWKKIQERNQIKSPLNQASDEESKDKQQGKLSENNIEKPINR